LRTLDLAVDWVVPCLISGEHPHLLTKAGQVVSGALDPEPGAGAAGLHSPVEQLKLIALNSVQLCVFHH